MTNHERIMAMTPEELAAVIMCPAETALVDEYPCGDGRGEDCTECCLKWLNEKAPGDAATSDTGAVEKIQVNDTTDSRKAQELS